MPETPPRSGSERRILHCDMDCFYAAVHQRDDPSLRGKPVIIGGNPHQRGVVAAASYEVREFGVHSAMPSSQAVRLCPHAIFLRPEFARYQEESQKIFAIYRDFTPPFSPSRSTRRTSTSAIIGSRSAPRQASLERFDVAFGPSAT